MGSFPIKHSDIPQAFIQSDLDSKQSYMDLPKGIRLRDTDGKLHTTVKLKRALYGLKHKMTRRKEMELHIPK